jgi:hypothetical protein
MRRLIFRPLVLLLTFLTGLFVTFILTFAGDGLARLLDEPSDTIPALCRSDSPGADVAACSQSWNESEEYAVYSAVLDQESEPGEMNSFAPLVIQNQTVVDYYSNGYMSHALEELKQSAPSLEQETLDNFRAGIEQPHPLKNLFRPPFRIIMISPQEVEGYFGLKGFRWPAFYKRYPKSTGLVILSKVGFNRAMNQAVVYRTFTCGDTCGYGSVVFLVKEGEVWKMKRSAGQWIS